VSKVRTDPIPGAKKGDSNDREAPTGLEIQPGKAENRGCYKLHHLQLKHGKSNLRGIGIAEESVEKKGGNLGLGTSPPTLFGHGDVVDRVGL